MPEPNRISFIGQKLTAPAVLFGIALVCFIVFGLVPVCVQEFREDRDSYEELQKKLVVMRMLLSRLELYRDNKVPHVWDLGLLKVHNIEARAIANGCDSRTQLQIAQLMNETKDYVEAVRRDWQNKDFHHVDHQTFAHLDIEYAGVSNALTMRNQVIFEVRKSRSQLLSICCLTLAGCFLLACLIYLRLKLKSEQKLTLMNTDLSNALIALTESREKQQQLEARKQELFAIISHEIRSPLGNIRNQLELLLKGVYGALPESATDRIGRANINVERLMVLINDLLALEKLAQSEEKLHLQPMAVSALIEEAVSNIETLAEQSDVQIENKSTNLWVLADKDLIVRVLINLLANAIKFSPASSMIEIQAHRHDGQIAIAVRDQGPGIPEEQLEGIFEKFKQINKDSRGSGLGLYLCRQLLFQHDGSIVVSNNQDKGCTFLVKLKAADEAPTRDDEPSVSAISAVSSGAPAVVLSTTSETMSVDADDQLTRI